MGKEKEESGEEIRRENLNPKKVQGMSVSRAGGGVFTSNCRRLLHSSQLFFEPYLKLYLLSYTANRSASVSHR